MEVNLIIHTDKFINHTNEIVVFFVPSFSLGIVEPWNIWSKLEEMDYPW